MFSKIKKLGKNPSSIYIPHDPQKLFAKWGVHLQNSSTYSPKRGVRLQNSSTKGGSAFRFHQLDGGPPLEFINIQLSPPKVGPSLEFIKIQPKKGVRLQNSSTYSPQKGVRLQNYTWFIKPLSVFHSGLKREWQPILTKNKILSKLKKKLSSCCVVY